MKDDDCEDRAQAQLASLKRDMRKTMEDATVRAMHKVMAEFEAKSDERVMEMRAQYSDIVSDGGLDPRNKFDQPAQPVGQPEYKFCDDGKVIFKNPEILSQRAQEQQQEPVAGCVCQWNDEGDRVVTCERHQGWLEVIAEWAERARDAEKRLKSLNTSPPAQQEPVAWMSTGSARMIHWTSDKPAYGDDWIPLYTTPPQRTWQGLTDEEVLDMARTFGAQPWPPGSCVAFGQMVEAKLKEKNE